MIEEEQHCYNKPGNYGGKDPCYWQVPELDKENRTIRTTWPECAATNLQCLPV